MSSTSSPVLFLVFKRPDSTRRVLEAIRQVKPAKLYVAADGPRNVEERGICERVREIATDVTWPCMVETLFRVRNLGTRRAITEAIDWFFEHEPAGVILEDDCVPDITFFRFCDELLHRYRNDRRVMTISGTYLHGDAVQVPESYFFSRYGFIWGWATWRRAWELHDSEMRAWPRLRDSGWLDQLSDGHADFRRYWTWRFDQAYSGEVDTWDFAWRFSSWVHGGLTAVPRKNLVRNIGFGPEATRTMQADWRGEVALESMDFPLDHPADVVRHREADRWADIHMHGTRWAFPFLRRVVQGVPGALPIARTLRTTLARRSRAARGD